MTKIKNRWSMSIQQSSIDNTCCFGGETSFERIRTRHLDYACWSNLDVPSRPIILILRHLIPSTIWTICAEKVCIKLEVDSTVHKCCSTNSNKLNKPLHLHLAAHQIAVVQAIYMTHRPGEKLQEANHSQCCKSENVLKNGKSLTSQRNRSTISG